MEIPTRQVEFSLIERVLLWWDPALHYKYVERKVAQARRKHRCVWRFVQDGGGGVMISPEALTESQAIKFVGANLGAVSAVDFQHRHIFYRSQK